MDPFVTFITPTYRRPTQLAACLASVAHQTAVARLEQLVIPDHVGHGIEGMYATLPRYADAVHGQYVHILADDDVLATSTVVEELEAFAAEHAYPPILLVRAQKGPMHLPLGIPWPPVMGRIDLGCVLTREDVWRRHVHEYGKCYEGDYVFFEALHRAGYESAAVCDLLFLVGAVSRGAPEAAA